MKHARVGFYLYRQKQPGGGFYPRWKIRFTGSDGRPAYATGFTDKGETARLAKQLSMRADEVRRGIREAPKGSDAECLRPIGEHVQAYLAWGNAQGGRGGRPWAPVHAAKQKWVLEQWVVAVLGLKTLREITLASIERALQAKQDAPAEGAKPLTGRTLNHYAMTLRAFTRWCAKRHFLEADPLDGLRKFTSPVKVPRRALSLIEVGKLLALAPPDRALLYRLALVTGFRVGELISLRVGDLDAVKGTLRLRADFAKDRRDAVHPLPGDLVDTLRLAGRGHGPEEPLLQGFERTHAAKRLYEDLEAAGIPPRNFHGKVDFHALRVTHVTLGIELGFDAKTAQTLARHKTPDLTMNLYAKANPDRLRGAVESLGRAFEGATDKARESGTRVTRQVLPLAAGAENQTYPIPNVEIATSEEVERAKGIEPS